MEALCGFSKAITINFLLFLLPFSNDHKLRLYPMFRCIFISFLASKIILIFSILLSPRLHLILYLYNLCNIIRAKRLILKESAQGYMLVAHLSWLFFCVIEHIELNCKLILKEFTILSILLPHYVDLSKWAFWAFVNLINAIRVLLKIVSHHLFTEQFEPCIIIINDEQSRLFIVLRQQFLFRKFLLFLKSIAREAILEVLGFSWSDFYLFVVEATRNFVTGEVEANLLGMIELKDIKILFVYPEQVPIFELND